LRCRAAAAGPADPEDAKAEEPRPEVDEALLVLSDLVALMR